MRHSRFLGVSGVLLQVNGLDSLGQTALHRVAQQGNMQACRLLMSYAVDPTIVSHQGYTAAQLATENIQKLLQGQLPCRHSFLTPMYPDFLILWD